MLEMLCLFSVYGIFSCILRHDLKMPSDLVISYHWKIRPVNTIVSSTLTIVKFVYSENVSSIIVLTKPDLLKFQDKSIRYG